MRKIIWLLLGLLILTGCVSLEPPKVAYLDSRVSRVTLEGAQVDFYFNVENKNPVPIDISGYSYKIFINDRELLSETQNGFSLPSNEPKKITLPIFVRYNQVFDSLIGVAANILAGKMYFDYKVEGSVSGGTMGLTVTAPLKASGRIVIPKEMLTI